VCLVRRTKRDAGALPASMAMVQRRCQLSAGRRLGWRGLLLVCLLATSSSLVAVLGPVGPSSFAETAGDINYAATWTASYYPKQYLSVLTVENNGGSGHYQLITKFEFALMGNGHPTSIFTSNYGNPGCQVVDQIVVCDKIQSIQAGYAVTVEFLMSKPIPADRDGYLNLWDSSEREQPGEPVTLKSAVWVVPTSTTTTTNSPVNTEAAIHDLLYIHGELEACALFLSDIVNATGSPPDAVGVKAVRHDDGAALNDLRAASKSMPPHNALPASDHAALKAMSTGIAGSEEMLIKVEAQLTAPATSEWPPGVYSDAFKAEDDVGAANSAVEEIM